MIQKGVGDRGKNQMKLENLDLAVISDSKSDDDDVNVAVAELPIV